jgi:hypothetical protein
MSSLAYAQASQAFPLLRFGLFLVGLGISFLVYQAGKKYITTSRLGQARFGPSRQRRKRILLFVMTGIVLLQVILLAGTVILRANPDWAARIGFSHSDPNLERLLVAIVGSLFVGPSTVLIAYFKDFLRGYYIAFILSLAVFSLIWFGQPIYLVIAGLLIMIPGLVLLIRFLRDHPQPRA